MRRARRRGRQVLREWERDRMIGSRRIDGECRRRRCRMVPLQGILVSRFVLSYGRADSLGAIYELCHIPVTMSKLIA